MAKVFVCGDVVNYQNEDGFVCAEDIEAVVKSADYAICNFEAPVAGYGTPQIKSGPHLAQSANTITGLREQGFSLLLLANNHMLDYGKEGLDATLAEAKKVGIETIGAGDDENSAYQPLIKKIDDITLGIINVCEAQFGVIDHFHREQKAGYAWINNPKVDTTVIALKKECDFVIVCAHAGLENYNIPQKEWRVRYKHFCDLGADVVIGSHPHVPQGYEAHNNSLIFYSLGNFYFDYGYAENSENHSYAVMLEFIKGELPGFKSVHHITKKQKVQLAKTEVNLFELCEALGEGYEKAHDDMNVSVYENIIKPNLVVSINYLPVSSTFKSTIKEILATVFGRRKRINKSLTQLHFTRNEAYYFATRHALEIKAKIQ